MKKVFYLLVVVFLSVFGNYVLTSCGDRNDDEHSDILNGTVWLHEFPEEANVSREVVAIELVFGDSVYEAYYIDKDNKKKLHEVVEYYVKDRKIYSKNGNEMGKVNVESLSLGNRIFLKQAPK